MRRPRPLDKNEAPSVSLIKGRQREDVQESIVPQALPRFVVA
jgi:hypothetical protein